MDLKEQTNNNSLLIVGLGFIVLIALILGWSAFNRSGEDVVPTATREVQETAQDIEETAEDVQEEAEETKEDLEYAALRAELETRLLVIKTGLEANQVEDETLEEIQALREDLMETHKQVALETQMEINRIDSELDKVEQNARNDTATALLTLGNLIRSLGLDVATNDAE